MAGAPGGSGCAGARVVPPLELGPHDLPRHGGRIAGWAIGSTAGGQGHDLGTVVRMEEVTRGLAPAPGGLLSGRIHHPVDRRWPPVVGPPRHHVPEVDDELTRAGPHVLPVVGGAE